MSAFASRRCRHLQDTDTSAGRKVSRERNSQQTLPREGHTMSQTIHILKLQPEFEVTTRSGLATKSHGAQLLPLPVGSARRTSFAVTPNDRFHLQ
jgi:hypothetical protein